MSDTPTYWSQPNQQVVRDGEPVGIVSEDPDPMADTVAEVEAHEDTDEDTSAKASRKAKSSK